MRRRKKSMKTSFLVRGLKRARVKFPIHAYIKKSGFKSIMFTALVEKYISQLNTVDNSGYTPLMLLLMYNRADGLYILFDRANSHNIILELAPPVPHQPGTVVHLSLKSDDITTVKTFFKRAHLGLKKSTLYYPISLYEQVLLDEDQDDYRAIYIVSTLLKYQFEVPNEFSDNSTLIESILKRLNHAKENTTDDHYFEKCSKVVRRVCNQLTKLGLNKLTRCKNSTSLHKCVCLNLPDVMGYILETVEAIERERLDTLIHQQNTDAYSPLALCVKYNFHEEYVTLGRRQSRLTCASILFQFGADINRVQGGVSPISLCFRSSANHPFTTELAILFIDKGATLINGLDVRRSLLRKAIKQCNEAILIKILQKEVLDSKLNFSRSEYKNALTVIIQSSFTANNRYEKLHRLVVEFLRYGVKLQISTIRALLKYLSRNTHTLSLLKTLLTSDYLAFDEKAYTREEVLTLSVIYRNYRAFKFFLNFRQLIKCAPVKVNIASSDTIEGSSRLIEFKNNAAVDALLQKRVSRRGCDLCCRLVDRTSLKTYPSLEVFTSVICRNCFFYSDLGLNGLKVYPLDVAKRQRSTKMINDLVFLEKIKTRLPDITDSSFFTYLREAKIDNCLLEKGQRILEELYSS